MKRFGSIALALGMAVATLPGYASLDRALIPADATFVPHEVIVAFDAAATPGDRARLRSRIGATVQRRLIGQDFELLSTALPVRAAVGTLAAEPLVRSVEPNYTGTIALDANDPCLNGCGSGKQWNVAAVNAPAAWDLVPGTFYDASSKKALAQRIKVAVLDTKIETGASDWINADPLPVNHPWDIANGGQLDRANILDIVPPSRQTGSADYHGTFVAGILGASANNGSAVAGLGYLADLVPITVVDGGGVVRAADLADGVMHARNVGARVINLSLGLFQTSAAVQEAIDLATAAGALVVAAAGNNADSEPFYPAWHRNAMAVAAVDVADRRAPCSNFSSQIAVAAPGMGILSLDPRQSGGTSVAGCGTSTAAPHVSALAALLFAQDPSRTPADVREIIKATADDDRFKAGRDDFTGDGRVNFERALRWGTPGPIVDRAQATVPRALGGSSSFTASATATSDRPIREAEWFLGRLGAPGTGQPMIPADGSWGGTTEDLQIDVSIPLGYPSGVHRLYVRARDDAAWGAASVGVLIVDRRAPQIDAYSVSPVALGTAAQPVVIEVEAQDDYASTLTYTFAVEDEMTDEVVFTSEEGSFSRATTIEWVPPAGLVGMYQVVLTVRDDGLNPARAKARTILL